MEELNPRCPRSNGRGLRQLALHLAALGAAGVALTLARGTPAVVPALLLYGVPLVFLFAAEHESIHGTAFRSPALCRAVAWLSGLVIVLPAGYFRFFHLAHHRHTQDPERDPELAAPKPRTLGQYVLAVSGLPHWADRIGVTLRHARGHVVEPWVPASAAVHIRREARVVLACYAGVGAGAVGFGSWAPLIYWVLPLLVAQPVLRLFLLAEHTGRPLEPDALANTRTTRTGALLRTLAWNMSYHAEHHLTPQLPFWALPALHCAIAPRVQEVAPGYVAFHVRLASGLRSGGRSASRAELGPPTGERG